MFSVFFSILAQIWLPLAAIQEAPVATSSGAAPTSPPVESPPQIDVLGKAKIIRGNEQPGMVAFTFDDGPSHKTTPIVLEALEKWHIPAAFFVVGKRFTGTSETSQKDRAVLLRIRRDGHLIGNHTFAHTNLRKASAENRIVAIDKNTAVLTAILGEKPGLFRAPYGAATPAISQLVSDRHMTEVRWKIDPFDFVKKNGADLRRKILEGIVRNNGGVVLMHDTKPWTVQQVDGIFGELQAINCERLRANLSPIWPVSLHYFLREHSGKPRPIPPSVAQKTADYKVWLTSACAEANNALAP